MSKKDKKFIAALIFLQTGILITTISLSGKFWYQSVANLIGLNQLHELAQTMKEAGNKAESNMKVELLKRQYEGNGIGVEKVKNITKE